MLFANCILVKGIVQSTICDVQRNAFHFIPNDLYDILNKCPIKLDRKSKIDFELRRWLDYLIEVEYGFLTANPEYFPSINNNWFSPYKIENSIIEIGKNSFIHFDLLIKILCTLNCKFLEIRFFKYFSIKLVKNLMKLVENSIISSIEMYIPYSKKLNVLEIIKMAENYPRISSIVIHGCDCKEKKIASLKVNFTEVTINSSKFCGIISSEYFSINIPTFTESQHHNTCLNRKLSIDAEGNIKNCPSLPEVYGNINDPDLDIIKIVESKEFQKYWNIKKDDIKICQVCEFRHVCTDCRAYREDPDDLYSKPLKCGYDPYTGEWEEWSTHPMKQKAIKYYGMEDLVKKNN